MKVILLKGLMKSVLEIPHAYPFSSAMFFFPKRNYILGVRIILESLEIL